MNKMLVFFILILAFLPTLPASAAPVFSDGFESNNFAAWTAQGANAATSTNSKHHGSYSCVINATDAQWAPSSKSIAAGATYYARAYFRMPTDTLNGAGWQSNNIMELRNAGWTDMYALSIGKTPTDTYRWGISCPDGAGYTSAYSSTFALDVAKYYCVEVAAFVNATNGYGKLYVDGVLACEVTGKDSDNQGNIALLVFAAYTNAAYSAYWDCFRVDTSYIGTEWIAKFNGKTLAKFNGKIVASKWCGIY